MLMPDDREREETVTQTTLIDDEFIAAVRRDMLRFARLQLRDAALAEDAVQEALLAALTGERQFSGRSALKTWVFGILRNKIVDQIRRTGRTTNISALTDDEHDLDESLAALFKPDDHWQPNERPADWGDPEQSLNDRQFWEVFEACLEHLPENTARVFMMREFLEFETAEVCRELGLSVTNCNVILHRARNGLRRCLERSWFAPGERQC